MAASSSAQASGDNVFGATPGGLNVLEIITVAVVGIIFSLIIVSAFRK